MTESDSTTHAISPGNLFNYFKECYKLDYKEFLVENILSQKYLHKWFVSRKEELMANQLPYIPYTNKNIDSLEKDIELYKLEKKLFYGSFFILGDNNNPLIRDKRFCAPLFLFPAEIVTINEDKFLRVDFHSCTINRAVISKLEFKNVVTDKDAFINELYEVLDNNHYLGLKNIVDKYVSNLQSEELLMFPQLWSATAIRSFLKGSNFQENQYKIVPAAGTVFVNKSDTSLKVINDLALMSSNNDFNTSLNELLGAAEPRTYEYKSPFYKIRLNSEQFKALKNANSYANSIVIGPPGTGKTYTITSIISDAVLHGKSVLVVSKTKQAVEVLRSMLEDEFKLKDYIIHTTGRNYRLSLQSKIRKYLSGMTTRGASGLSQELLEFKFEKLKRLENEFNMMIEKELKLSDLEFNDSLGVFDKLHRIFLKTFNKNGDKLWSVFRDMNILVEKLELEVKTYSRNKIRANIVTNVKHYRNDIALFYEALDSSSFTAYKAILQEVKHKNILRVFPVWLANLSELNAVLPLQKDLFDMVIIDEATQCDIASALPAIYRAKHAIIVGDPNQLRHYSFVSTSQQQSLLKKYKLLNNQIFDYRNKSILDVYLTRVQKQDQVTFLREHFRSTPSLIEFSNVKFYDSQLEVLKSTPKHTSHNQIELIEVEGYRNSKGVNEIEAQAVIRVLDTIINEYKTEQVIPSIGVISPFTSQVNHINKLLKKKYEYSIFKDFKLFCGTPYSFQGSEREIVLLSFALCDESHPSAFIHANKPEVLNVAITRAKSYQYVFKSVSDLKVNNDSLIAQYFSFVKDFIHYKSAEVEIDDFQKQLVEGLQHRKFDHIKCGYPVAGHLLDVLVVYNERNYFIDLIGYPGMYKTAFSFERYQTLSRTGIHSLPLHFSMWNDDKEEALNYIESFIKQNYLFN